MSKLDLTGKWKLRGEFFDVTAERFYEVASKEDGEFKVMRKNDDKQAMPSKAGFMEARVPCDVITPLIENNFLQEPTLKTNSDDCMWVGDLSWWFLREFEVSSGLLDNEEVRLFIEILDYNADIILNGRIIASHKNAFRAFESDVKRFLKAGKNQIIIRLTGGYEERHNNDSLTYYSNSKYGQRVYLRKAQYTHGWDWTKPVPTCGIGGEVYLEGVSGAKICFFRCDTLELKNNTAKLNFCFEIENLSMCSADDAVLSVELLYGGRIVARFKKEFYAAGGVNFINEEVVLNNPELWFPNGYGRQPLYTVQASVECRGVTNSMKPRKIGIRTIELNQDKMPDGGRRFDVIVNGVKVFCKGGNWVPADMVYLRVDSERYKVLVEEAAACNFNMLRMWGGGLYELDCFYDYCSEYGIMLMHDFMYACAFYPDYLDWFMYEARLEAEYQTRRLAHYACMAIWTGNNEIHESYTDWFKGDVEPEYYYGTKIFNYMLPDVVRSYSPTLPYMPSSPFYGNKANDISAGDCHLWNWTRGEWDTAFKFNYELEAFDRIAAKVRMSTEYGIYGALKYSSVERFHDGEEIKLGSKIWKHHGEHDEKRKFMLEVLERHLIDNPADLSVKDYLLYCGIAQGLLYDELTLALRRYEHCSGKLIWMYNDCWPETGWTVIDYYMTRKISFYYLKRAFETCKFIVRETGDKISMLVINETPEAQKLRLEHGYMSFTGEKSGAEIKELVLEPHSRTELNSGKVSGTGGFCYMLALDNENFQPATSLRGYYKDIKFPAAKIETSQSGNMLTLRCDVFVPVVGIKLDDDTVKMSDNYFALLPGVAKTIEIYGSVEGLDIVQI
jgi:beta-mannosidase